MVLERISQSARFCCGNWVVGVHVVGTAGSLARFGLAMTDGTEFWDFEESDKETALCLGQ